ncbi:fe08394a-5151-4cba-860c-b4a131ac3e89 [Sclerotinia trifoliorum]|uniref:Fe08394a-5151-4cba-860c-b4a131ac3e89 n=1 Tax=Sclerotinia trifoliorum TaxID=28548 RepID=A0A8H2VRW3_9HELO|nr:fe08394a-5151-4cba-860c-b4a131ac3e89 [Sclerotinia trifoliorum]
MAGSALQISKPMSIKEISAKASDFEFNPTIALKYWLRTADTLLREAHIYQAEDNDQQAYLLFMRYAALVAEKLPEHPFAKDPETRSGLRAAQKSLPDVLDRLEKLKPGINARYNNWQRTLERRKEIHTVRENDILRPSSRADLAASDPAIAGNTTTLAAAENGELAVRLAHKEIKRRNAVRRATRQAGVSEEEEQERRTAGLWDDWEAALSKSGRNDEDDDMRRNMEASRRRLDGSHDISPDGLRRRSAKPPSRPARYVQTAPRNGSSEYRYPSISKSQPLIIDDSKPYPPPDYLPPKPPKEEEPGPPSYETPPPIPEKQSSHTRESSSSEMVGEVSKFTFRPSAYLENGKPLRTVFLPPTLRREFLACAASNTRANLETCGMLCGTLISNALFVSRLVVPEQKSTSDTCETTNEGAFFDYCASEDLMVLGWIHTHPTQSCFMSSRDLHTHCGYQIMMPESIAIVCAPSKTPSWGVFRLTDPPGMPAVLNCKQTGLFHPHEERNIYTDALRPGHVFEAEGLEFQVVDQRPKR